MWADFLFVWEGGGGKDVARPQTFPSVKGAVGG